MSLPDLQKFYEKYKIKHPTAFLHKGAGLSVVAERMIPAMAFIIQQTEKDEEGYYWGDSKYFQYAVGQGGNNRVYQPLNDAVDELYDADLNVNIFVADKTFQNRRARIIFERAIEKREGGKLTRIGFKPHPEFEKKCKEPNVYAFYSVVMLMLLRESKFALPYYQLCSDILGRASKEEKAAGFAVASFDLEDLKLYFGVEGKYPAFKDFNKRVLSPARDATNEKTDICGQHHSERVGRKIARVRFEVRFQQWQLPMFEWLYLHDMAAVIQGQLGGELSSSIQKLPPVKSVDDTKMSALQILIDRAVGYGTGRRTVTQFADQYGYEGLEEVLIAFEAYKDKSTTIIKNEGAALAGFLRDKTGMRTPEDRKSGAVDDYIRKWLEVGKSALKEHICAMPDAEWRMFHAAACDFENDNYTAMQMGKAEDDRDVAWKDSTVTKGFFRYVVAAKLDWRGVFSDPIAYAKSQNAPKFVIDGLQSKKNK